MAAIHPRPASPSRGVPAPPADGFGARREHPSAHLDAVDVTHCDDRGTWLISLRGEHDITTIPHVDERTRTVWPVCRIAVIDLSDVTFVDSSMINWLLRVEGALEAVSCSTLSIATGPFDGVAGRLFARLRMSEVLACYATRRDAFMQAVAGVDAIAWPPLAADALGTDMARGRRAA